MVRSGRTGRVVALVAGVAFLLGLGAVAVAGLSGARDGAESPDAAVEQLAAALGDEDVIAALEVMAPSEVGSASQLYPRLIELAVQEGELQSTDWLAGVDFTVTGLELSVEQLHPDVARVELLAGTIAVDVDPDVADPMFLENDPPEAISIEDLRQEMADAIEGAQQGYDDELFPLPFTVVEPDGIFIMTVKRGGGWFVSPLYTAAEYGRQLLDLPPADFDASRADAAAGADTPSGVIDGIVSLVSDHPIEDHIDAALGTDGDIDYGALHVFVPPDEFGVFLDYSSSYLQLFEDLAGETDISFDELRQEMKAMFDELELEGRVDLRVDVREEARADGAVVLYLESGSANLELSAIDPDSDLPTTVEAEASWDGLCGDVSVVVDGVPEESGDGCVPEDERPEGLDEAFVVVSEVDGSWYVSYVETVLAYAEIFLEDALEN